MAKQDDSDIEAEVIDRFRSKPPRDRNWESMYEIMIRIQECRKQHEDVRKEMESKLAAISGRVGYLYQQLRKAYAENKKS